MNTGRRHMPHSLAHCARGRTSMRDSRPETATSIVEYCHRPALFVPTMYSVPEPLGPEIGIATFMFPDDVLSVILPVIQNPTSIGSPSWALMSAFDRTRV